MTDELLQSILIEGLLPAVSVWGASFYPYNRTTTCKALRLHGWEGLKVQIGASEHLRHVIHHEAFDSGEDGVEPAFDETADYHFLGIENVDTRDLQNSATLETCVGVLNSIDVFTATYEVRHQEGTTRSEVLGGLRFNYADVNASFGFLQRRADQRIDIGPASAIFQELPSHIRLARQIVANAQ